MKWKYILYTVLQYKNQYLNRHSVTTNLELSRSEYWEWDLEETRFVILNLYNSVAFLENIM